jgi:hypothetical protein
MGGNALQETYTRRYEKAEYFAFAEHVTNILKAALPNVRIAVIEAFGDKDSFGDLDLLIEDLGDSGTDTREKMKGIYEDLGITELVRSKEFSETWAPEIETWSVGGFDGELQVDLIYVPTKYFESAERYYAYNDLGNMVGRVADSMGLKHGHRGLSYVLYDPTNDARVIKEISITTDYHQALAFLGYDVERFKQGFQTLQEILEFVLSTKYLLPRYFMLENRGYRNRVRDAKRPNYRAILALIAEKGLVDHDDVPSKDDQLDRAAKLFPAFGAELAQEVSDFAEYKLTRSADREAVKSRFSAEVVSGITGINGTDLGIMMSVLREEALSKGSSLSDYVKDLSTEAIVAWTSYVHKEKYLKSDTIRVNLKFNSAIVGSITGFGSRRLSKYIKELRIAQPRAGGFDKWILETPQEEINAWIKQVTENPYG